MRLVRSKPKGPPDWNDRISSGIPEYRAYQDVYAQGYIEQLKKNNKFGKYIREVSLRPGGIRAVKGKERSLMGRDADNLYAPLSKGRRRPDGKIDSLSVHSNATNRVGESPSRLRPSGSQGQLRRDASNNRAAPASEVKPPLQNKTNLLLVQS